MPWAIDNWKDRGPALVIYFRRDQVSLRPAITGRYPASFLSLRIGGTRCHYAPDDNRTVPASRIGGTRCHYALGDNWNDRGPALVIYFPPGPGVPRCHYARQ